MPGAIIGDFDVAQGLVIAFVLFFFGLVLHLRAEDKREGYPLKDPAGGSDAVGFPALPRAKLFHRPDGTIWTAPHPEPPRDIPGRPLHRFPGSPLVPDGDPFAESIGPGSYALRREEPLFHRPNQLQVVPLRTVDDWKVADGDMDPRGFTVVGADGAVAGVVSDLWVDRSVKVLRYLEVELEGAGRRALLPLHHTDIRRERCSIRVDAATAAQFADAPQLADPDRITAREEDQVNAFYAGAAFFGRETRRAALWKR